MAYYSEIFQDIAMHIVPWTTSLQKIKTMKVKAWNLPRGQDFA